MNIISAAVTKDVNALDIGGLLVTLCRIFNDTKFICKLEYGFLNRGLSQLYEDSAKSIGAFRRLRQQYWELCRKVL